MPIECMDQGADAPVTDDPTSSVLLGAAAVLDDRFDLATLAAVAGLPVSTVQDALCPLVETGVLRRFDAADVYAFTQPDHGPTAYRDLDPEWCTEAHRRALTALRGTPVAPVVLARHLEAARTGAEPSDVEVLAAAADLVAGEDPEASARWLRLAVDSLEAEERDGPRGTRLQVRLAVSLGLSGRLLESRALLHACVPRIEPEDVLARAGAVAFTGLVDGMLGNSREAAALLAAELAEPGASVCRATHARLLVLHGLVLALDGSVADPSVAARLAVEGRTAVQEAVQAGDVVLEAAALSLEALASAVTGDPGTVEVALVRAGRLVDGLADGALGEYLEYVLLLGSAEAFTSRYHAARRHFRRAAAIARERGRRHVLPNLLNGLSNTERRLGLLAAAGASAAESARVAQSCGAHQLQGLALAQESLTATLIEPSGSPRPVELAERALSILHATPNSWWVSAAIALAFACEAAGEARRCRAVLLDAGSGRDLTGLPAVLRPWCYELLAASALAEGEDPTDWAERAARAGAEFGPAQDGYVRSAAAHRLVARGEHADAVDEYRAAARSFARSGLVGAQARALVHGAEAARNLCAGKQADGRDPRDLATLAIELARRQGADRIRMDAEDLLAELEGPPEPPPAPDVDPGGRLKVLTDRERDVARAAAAGMRSREIAVRLEISPRTVDVHLTRIYRKLGITSRAQLASLLTRPCP